jgi:glycosyltransferase involved in cell wall biosynthesis
MIEDGVNGILIEPDHPEQITEQMIQLLSQKEMCDRIGKRAKETVMKKFPLKNYIDEMEKAFDSMVLKEVFF